MLSRLLTLALLAATLCACAPDRAASPDGLPAVALLGLPAIPADDLSANPRQASLDSLILTGDKYWQKSPRADEQPGMLVLTPPYQSFDFGIYQFPIDAADDVNRLTCYVSERSTLLAPIWLALADYSTGMWQLLQPQAGDTYALELPGPLANYTSPGGYFYVAVIADGTESFNVRCLELWNKNLPDQQSAWGTFGHDAQRTRRTTAKVVDSANVLWKSFLPTQFVTSAPALGSDGTIYIGTWTADDKGQLLAINPDGTLLWEYDFVMPIKSSPAIGPDGCIYVGCDYFSLYCINRLGLLRWRFQTLREIQSSPVIGADGTVYFGSGDFSLHAVHPDGTAAWELPSDSGLRGSPALAIDGTIYATNVRGDLRAVNPDGSEAWMYNGDGEANGAVCVGSDGTVYYATESGNLYAVNPDGSERGKHAAGGQFVASPALAEDGRLFIGNDDGKLYVYDADAALVTTFDSGAPIKGSAVIDGNGRIFFANTDGHIYALNSDLSVQWEYQAAEELRDSPCITGDGVMYFAGLEGTLYAFGPNAPQPPAVPTGLSASQGSFYDRIRLTWDEQYDADGFEIYKDGSDMPIATVGYVFTWDDIGIPDNTPHTYRLKAVNEYGSSEVSDAVMGIATGMNPGAGEWAMLGCDAAHSGNCSLSGPHTKHLDWSYKAGDYSYSSPVIGAQGEVYFTTAGSSYQIVTVDSAGAFRWAYPVDTELCRSLAIDDDGYIYAAESGRVFRMKPDGTEDWSVPYADRSFGGITLYGDRVYICGESASQLDYTYVLLKADGSEIWKYPKGNRLCVPAVGTSGIVFTADQGGNRIYAINYDGSPLIELGGNQNVESPPVVRTDVINGDVVLFCSGDDLYAKKLDDSLVFSFVSDLVSVTGSAVLPDGSGYYLVGSHAQKVGLDGGNAWDAPIGGNGSNQLPAVDADGYIYVATASGAFRCIAPDGTLAWEYAIGSDLRYSSPAIGPGSRVYICAENGTLYAFGPEV